MRLVFVLVFSTLCNQIQQEATSERRGWSWLRSKGIGIYDFIAMTGCILILFLCSLLTWTGSRKQIRQGQVIASRPLFQWPVSSSEAELLKGSTTVPNSLTSFANWSNMWTCQEYFTFKLKKYLWRGTPGHSFVPSNVGRHREKSWTKRETSVDNKYLSALVLEFPPF